MDVRSILASFRSCWLCKRRYNQSGILEILLALVSTFLARRSNAVQIFTIGHGSVSSMSYPECPWHGKEHQQEWNFQFKQHPIVILKFRDFDLSPCSKAQLVIQTLEVDPVRYCEHDELGLLHYDKETSLSIKIHGKNCGRGIAFDFVFPGVTMTMEDLVAPSAQVSMFIPMLPPEVGANCELETGDFVESFDLLSKPRKIQLSPISSGSWEYVIGCVLQTSGTDVKRIGRIGLTGSFNVEDDVSATSFLLNAAWKKIHVASYGSLQTIEVNHIFAYPLTYHIVLGKQRNIAITKIAKYSPSAMHNRPNMTMTFTITRSHQDLLGPGTHEMTLMLENDVSSATLLSSLMLCTKLTALTVDAPKYVDLYPKTFPVTVRITDGSPANVQINITRYGVYKIVSSHTTMCNNTIQCSEFEFSASVPSAGVYGVEVSASNSLGTVSSSYGPVESFHMVHEVLVTSKSPVRVGKEAEILVFYKIASDDGVFEIEILAKQKILSQQTLKTHTHWQDVQNAVGNMILPFDPSNLKIFLLSHMFSQSGNYDVVAKITTENRKVTLQSRTMVKVLPVGTKMCLSAVKIRDGNEENFNNVTLQGKSTVLLSADVETNCDFKGSQKILYKWSIHKVEDLSDAPTGENEIQVHGLEMNHNELVIRKLMLLPGLYVIKISVALTDFQGTILNEVPDYTSINVEKPKLDAQVCGGRQIEIGQDTAEVMLDASCSLNPRKTAVEYRWFCVLTEAELPPDKYVGTYRNKGSCNRGQPSLIGKGQTLEYSRKNTNITEEFYVRVFASAKNFEDSFADQYIKVLPHPAPIVNIICWKNCGKSLKPQELLVLQIECDSCVFYRWKPFLGAISSCESEKFCRIPSQLLIQMQKAGKLEPVFRVDATGFDGLGNATATFQAPVDSLPSISACKVLFYGGRPVVSVTTFNISCPYGEGLMYKFSLKNEDGTNPMLQYGYENTLSGLVVALGVTNVIVEICNSEHSCFAPIYPIEAHKADTSTEHARSMSGVLNNAIKSGNLQKAVFATATLPNHVQLSDEIQMRLTEVAIDTEFASTESAKQVSDILLESTKNPMKNMGHVAARVFEKVTTLKDWILKDTESSSEFLSTVARSSMHVTSNVMEALSQSSEAPAASHLYSVAEVVDDLGKELLDSVLPGEKPVEVNTPSFKGFLRKLERNTNAKVNGDDVQLQFQTDWKTIRPNDVVNIQVVRFNSSSTNSGSPVDDVGDVVALSYSKSYKTRGKPKSEKDHLIPEHPIKFYLQDRNRTLIKDSTELRFEIPYMTFDSKNMSITLEGDVANTVMNIRLISDFIRENVVLNMTLQRRMRDENVEKEFKRSRIIKGVDFKRGHHVWQNMLSAGEGVYDLNIGAQVEGGALGKGGAVTFTLNVVTDATKCRIWDEWTKEWRREGCKAISGGEDEWDWCECDFRRMGRLLKKPRSLNLLSSKLSVFSNQHPALPFVKPNKINLDFVESENGTINITETVENVKEEIIKNPIVVSVITSIFLMFGMAMIWARSDDKKRSNSLLYSEVCDNSPLERYRYFLTVFTGSRRAAKPTSTVVLKISGDSGTTIHILQKSDDEEQSLQRKSVVSFLLTTFKCLGDISSLQIWMDNKGDNPHWFIDRLVVRDLETNECRFFLARKWLHDEIPEEGPMILTLHPAPMKQLHSFRNLFVMKLSSHLKKSHLWYSVFASRPWSCNETTRVQRVCCCMLLTLMIVLTSLMFYGRMGDGNDVIGLFSVVNIIAGLESGLLCFPVTHIITVMFRSSRRRGVVADSELYKYLTPSMGVLGESYCIIHHQKSGTRVLRRSSSKSSVLSPNSGKIAGKKFTDRRRRQPQASGRSRYHSFSKCRTGVTIPEVDPASGTFKPLPWFCRPLAWIVIVVISAGSTLLSVLYGITYGYDASVQWLVSFAFAVLESIFVLEPIKVVVLAYFSVASNPRLDVSDWILPLRNKVFPKKFKNPKKVAKRLAKERKENPLYRGPVV